VGRTPLTLADIRAWNALQEQGSLVSRAAGGCWLHSRVLFLVLVFGAARSTEPPVVARL
jgi:hypothetical protein